MSSIKEQSFSAYQLVGAEIKSSKDGKTKYVVADFVRDGLDEMLSELDNGIRLQILPRFGAEEAAANAYLQKWVDRAKAKDYVCNIGSYTVGDFEKFLRKDTEGKFLVNAKKEKIVFTDVNIYWFCDEEGNPLKGANYITKRAENLFKNSTRIVTLADYQKQRAAAKAAAEAAKAADDLLADADTDDTLGD